MSQRDDVQKVFDGMAYTCRFRRTGQVWLRQTGDASIVLDLQAGPPAGTYHINIGFWPSARTADRRVAVADISRVGLEDLLPRDVAARLQALLCADVPTTSLRHGVEVAGMPLAAALIDALSAIAEPGSTELGMRRLLRHATHRRRPLQPLPGAEDGRLTVASEHREDAVIRATRAFAKPHGFRKRARTWLRNGDEVTAGFNLQRSEFSPRYYLNVGFTIRALSDNPHPTEGHWHVRGRIEALGPSVDELLDLDERIGDAERIARLTHVLEADLLPVLDAAGTVQGLRQVVARFPRLHAVRIAQDLLGADA